jgi:predicted nucleic acid-binding protein
MPGYVLDTTVLIDYARAFAGGPELVERLFGETGDLYTCDVISAEALSTGDELERDVIGRLLDALEYIAIDPEGARWAGGQRHARRLAGRRAPLADALIAATAWRMGATVVTRNGADFELFGVPVLAYGMGPGAKAGTKRGSTP